MSGKSWGEMHTISHADGRRNSEWLAQSVKFDDDALDTCKLVQPPTTPPPPRRSLLQARRPSYDEDFYVSPLAPRWERLCFWPEVVPPPSFGREAFAELTATPSFWSLSEARASRGVRRDPGLYPP